jgi:hypothetical protein
MQNMNDLCVISVSLVLLLAGILMILVGLRDLAQCARAYWRLRSTKHTWSTTTGQIVSSEAMLPTLRKPFHSVNVRYEYSVGDQRYVGTRIRDSDVVIAASRIEMVLKEQFSAGHEVKVFYNLLNPAHATLDLELRPACVRLIMVGGLSILLGSGLIYAVIWFWIMLFKTFGAGD